MRRDLFDIRNVIAALLGVFGVILVIVGCSAGTSVNLWTGAGLIAVAALFVAWALLRPVLPPD